LGELGVWNYEFGNACLPEGMVLAPGVVLACFEPGVFVEASSAWLGRACGARASVLYARTREEMCVDFGFSTYPTPDLLAPQEAHQ